MPELTVERVRELFSYDPDTGLLVWKKPPTGRHLPALVAGVTTKQGSRRTGVSGKRYYNHRLIWLLVYGEWPTNVIDHINGDPADNRLENLRDVTPLVNQQNKRVAHPGSMSGLLGAHWDKKTQKFKAQIVVAKKAINLGRYTTPDEAHRVYLEAKRRLHDGCTI